MSKVNNMTLTISGPEDFVHWWEWQISRDEESIGLIRKGKEDPTVDVLFHNSDESLDTGEMKQIISFMEGINIIEKKVDTKIHTGDNIRCIDAQYSHFLMINEIYLCGDMNIDDRTVKVPGSDVWWDIERFEKVT